MGFAGCENGDAGEWSIVAGQTLEGVRLQEEGIEEELIIVERGEGWSFSFRTTAEFSGSECELGSRIACGQIPILLFTI